MRGEFLDLKGVRLYYYAAGSRGAGEPVVLLHGFPTSSHLWTNVVPLLPAGHRVVVLDLLGYGRSDRPGAGSVSLRAHASRLIAVLDALGIDVACVVGHDIGGGIAQIAAVNDPARISRLGLIDCIAFDGWMTADLKITRALMPLARHLPPAWIHAAVRATLLRGWGDRDKGAHDVDLYLRPFLDADGRNALLGHIHAFDASETGSISAQLAHLTIPTSIVWGLHDPFVPVSVGERLHATIPGSTLEIIPGARHFTPHESANAVAHAIGRLLKR